MQNLNLTVRSWHDYELIDSGNNRKLERFGKIILIRPETQALWQPTWPEEWKRAIAEFQFVEGGKGGWNIKDASGAKNWEMQWNAIRFMLHIGSFKHTGVFPEQAANWEWIAEWVMHVAGKGSGHGSGAAQSPKVLNLFGYTGIASIAAAQAGAQVTHVDASKQSNEWAKENARLSGIASELSSGESASMSGKGSGTGSIRYLFDDALKFVEREVRRGTEYDGIILDPPAFGRGAKGEVWHIEEELPRLLDSLAKIFSKKPGSFFLLNGYAAGYSPKSFEQATKSSFSALSKPAQAEFGELQIQESNSERVIPSGIYVRFVV